MTKQEPQKRTFGKYLWLLGAVIFAAVVVYFMVRENYTNEMISKFNGQLMDHDLEWAGRGPDYAQYRMTLHDERDSVFSAVYRIPASTQPTPALVVLHSYGDADSVFALLKQVSRTSECAIVAIDVRNHFYYTAQGKPRTSNKYLGRALKSSVRAADIALEFVRGHRIVDTSAVYLIGVAEGALAALPAAANAPGLVSGIACLRNEVTMSLRDWQPDEFGSPLWWAKQIPHENVLVVNSGEQSKRSTKLVEAFTKGAGNVQQVSGDPDARSLEAVMKWILAGREAAEPPKKIDPPDPTKDETIVVRKG